MYSIVCSYDSAGSIEQRKMICKLCIPQIYNFEYTSGDNQISTCVMLNAAVVAVECGLEIRHTIGGK